MDGLEMRPVVDAELRDWMVSIEASFGDHVDDEDLVDARHLVELDRTLGVLDGGAFVGGSGAYSFELTVPGPATVSASGVTAVGVAPTHRRRGLLRTMMARLLDDASARGEPLAVLTASESAIYGRFGYGLATSTANLRIDVRDERAVAFAAPPATGGRLRLVEPDEAAKVIPGVFDAYRRLRVGEVVRSDGFWAVTFRDPDVRHEGLPRRFYVVHESDRGRADGYAMYRVKSQEAVGAVMAGEATVEELVAVDPEVEAALWRYCLDLDLVATVTLGRVAIDSPLRWRLADPRHHHTTAVRDWLWVRLVDVAGALGARRYREKGSVTFAVTDRFRPDQAGTYRLTVDADGEADCVRLDDGDEGEGDLALDVADLGAAYLGGVSFSTLAAAGRVVERTAGALERADALFATHPAPFCTTMF